MQNTKYSANEKHQRVHHDPGRILYTIIVSSFTKLIQMSLDESYIPRIWKTSTIVPVAKKRSAKELNDYRPVAHTFFPFKCAEKIVLRLLRSETAGHQDPLQFAYSKDKSTEDAILTLLHRLYDHLDKPKSYCEGSVHRLL